MRLLFLILLSGFLVGFGYAFDPATQDDSQALVRHFKKPAKPLPPFADGKFEPMQGETITLMGGTDMYRMPRGKDLEALLYLAFPDKNLVIRSIGWPADTVYRQQRPMFFYMEKGDTKEGSVPDQREKIEPGVFILQFGRMESLQGLSVLPRFAEVFEKLLGELKKISPRILILSPRKFTNNGPAGEFAEERNETLKLYAKEMETIASRNGFLYRDSLADFFDDKGVEVPVSFLEKVAQKRSLWTQYYRPTNWAFLFGDRQHVPSSRDHRDANQRWFVEELKKLPPLIDQADQAIWEEAKKVVK